MESAGEKLHKIFPLEYCPGDVISVGTILADRIFESRTSSI